MLGDLKKEEDPPMTFVHASPLIDRLGKKQRLYFSRKNEGVEFILDKRVRPCLLFRRRPEKFEYGDQRDIAKGGRF